MTRRRRTPDEAKREILETAERLLAESGPAAVNVRAVAARIGMTDAGVHHHFGSREQLLQALLRHGGRRLRAVIETTLSSWLDDEAQLEQLIASLSDVYRRGFAELAASLHAAGWRDRGVGLFEPVVEALHQRRRDPSAPIGETRLAVAALHQALAVEPLYGAIFRRSAGVTGRSAHDPAPTYRWWAEHLRRSLDLRESKPTTAERPRR